jgi:hypothetical protein
MHHSPLTPREKKLARRNYVLLCVIATAFCVLFAVVVSITTNG